MNELYTVAEIARAAGVERERILKLTRGYDHPLIICGKKGGKLIVSRLALEIFTFQHDGKDRQLILRALRNL